MSNDANIKSLVSGNCTGQNSCIILILRGSEELEHCKKLAKNCAFDSKEHKGMVPGSKQGERIQRIFMCTDWITNKWINMPLF